MKPSSADSVSIPTTNELGSCSICILPDLWSHADPASREMSLFSAAPAAALSSAVQISVCLIPTAPIHHGRARRLSPELQTTANKATFSQNGCSLAPPLSSAALLFSLHVLCVLSFFDSSSSPSVSVFVSSLDFTRFSQSSLSFSSPLHTWLLPESVIKSTNYAGEAQIDLGSNKVYEDSPCIRRLHVV